ncbi:unnamed protein product [Effrenium voratum]|nr:unnamed protein product [Effrenium voratum]
MAPPGQAAICGSSLWRAGPGGHRVVFGGSPAAAGLRRAGVPGGDLWRQLRGHDGGLVPAEVPSPHRWRFGLLCSHRLLPQRDGRQEAFWNATMHTFRFFGSEGCPGEVDKALGLLQQQSQDAAGRRQISEALGSCEDLENETTAGAKVDFFLRGVFATLAMLDYPVASNFVTLLPANPAKVACQRLQSSTVNDLEALISKKGCGPLLIRLSWHDAGVFNGVDGCPNAAMRFSGEGENCLAANAGLPDVALGLLQAITDKYVPRLISNADLWALAANTAIKE